MTTTTAEGAPTTSGVPDDERRRDRRRLVLRYLVGAVIVILLVVLIGPRGRSGPPLDPRSTSALGTRGIVEVLERLDVDVRVDDGAPTAGDGVALVISDTLGDDQHQELREWVEQGGRLVLADPVSDLAPDLVGVTTVGFTEPTIQPACEDPLVAGVDRVAVQGGSVFEPASDATGCFPRNDGFWMVRTPQGAGEVITIGGPLTLTNELLGIEDTAVLAVNLLTPPEGDGLHVVTPDETAQGTESLTEVLPDQVGLALLQIPVAWLALIWWRGRRHGRPVTEPTPVRIEAAETTVAVGNLLFRAGRVSDAAAIIRGHVHRELSRRLGIPADEARTRDPETYVSIVASRTDLSPETLRALLIAPLPTDDTGLVRYANTAASTVGHIRQRQTADPRGGSTAATPTSPSTTGAPST